MKIDVGQLGLFARSSKLARKRLLNCPFCCKGEGQGEESLEHSGPSRLAEMSIISVGKQGEKKPR